MIREFYWSFLGWFATTKLWRWIARNILAHVNLRLWGYPKFPMHRYYEIERLLYADPEAMWVFVGVDQKSLSWKLNHWVTGCKWSHAGFVRIGSIHGEPHLVQMLGSGLSTDRTLLDYLRELDHFALMKIEFSSQEAKMAALYRYNSLVKFKGNIEYDYALTLDLDSALVWLDGKGEAPKHKMRLYCSEFVYAVAHTLSSNPNFIAQPVAGRPAFEPDDLYAATTCVLES